jgi:hypothetical protein
MRDLTWSGPRTLSLGEADGLTRDYAFAPGQPVEVTEKDADAILGGERAEGFLEGGAKRTADIPEPDRDASAEALAGDEEE